MKKTCLLGWFAAALVLVSCQNSVNTVENADKTMTPNTISDSRFVTDGFLKRRLALQSLTTGRTADGFMRAQLEVVNVRTGVAAQFWSGITGENPYTVAYKFVWMDEAGMAVETNLSVWRTIQIKPGETVFFKSVAPNARCRDFLLNLKESD